MDHHDRRRGSRRGGGELVRAGRRGPQGGQEDPLRRPWRPDRVRRLPRLTRHLPDRHLQSDRGGGCGRQHHRCPATLGHSVSLFVESVGFGLITAAVLSIAAVGFTLQFAVTNVLNLAFAAVMTAGAFVAYWINQLGVSVWIGLAVAMVVCSL